MEPVVILDKLPQAGTTTICKTPPRRKKGRQFLFDRRKSGKYSEKGFIRDSCGWPSDADHFLGFTDSEQALAAAHCTLAAIENEDIVTFPRTAVASISQSCNVPFTFYVQPVIKRRARILSLCDGVSTGLLIWKKLNLQVDTYFSSEVCPDALMVQKTRFPGEIIALGDVRHLDETLLNSLGYIHFLIAGPPCSDLSLVNASRKEWGDDSTAFRSVDVARIKNYLRRRMYEARSPFFYFVEQTAHLATQARARLVSELGSQPETICSSAFTAAYRRRLYFSNIPGMPELAAKVKGTLTNKTLQHFLDPYSYALVRIAPTLTSNSSSQHYPVLERGVRRKLNIAETERVMGYPTDFTSVGCLSQQRRLRLVGRGWCRDAIAAMWSPLAEMFL